MRIPTYIVGAGGLGRGVLETVNMIASQSRNWEVEGFIDDNVDLYETTINGINVVGGIDYLMKINSFTNIILAIANPNIKEMVYERLKENSYLFFPNIIHPNVALTPSTKIGWGNIISENVSFSADVEIGNFSLIHFNSTIGHDVKLEDYVTVYPGANISGFVKLKCKSEIGSNACIMPSKTIFESAMVGAGALVRSDVFSKTVVAGVPAHEIKRER
ncbi:acetyltransferase [Sporosarcina jiandibaonis]|uniref:acetyltransferase n=1 Tax=Sporosarcina jiandibaonis TaxID=2715535 RepID=UPI0015526A41|nr:acetyltransferase [Sporosarcina jiandibaonis]